MISKIESQFQPLFEQPCTRVPFSGYLQLLFDYKANCRGLVVLKDLAYSTVPPDEVSEVPRRAIRAGDCPWQVIDRNRNLPALRREGRRQQAGEDRE